jgi:hypothetical protein
VVREERRLVISKLHQELTTKMPMLLNPTHYETNSTQNQIHPYSLTPQMISKSYQVQEHIGEFVLWERE